MCRLDNRGSSVPVFELFRETEPRECVSYVYIYNTYTYKYIHILYIYIYLRKWVM